MGNPRLVAHYFQPDPEALMSRTFFITFDTYEPQWAGHLTIGQPAYLWSSADMGDAHLVDSEPWDSIEGAIASLKTELKKLFDALSLSTKPAWTTTTTWPTCERPKPKANLRADS